MSRTQTRKILLVGWFFYPRTGGVETLMLNQARYLLELGDEVHVLTSLNVGLQERENLDGIDIIRRQFMKTTEEYPLSELEKELRELLDEVNPDIVHFHNGSYPAATLDRSIGVKKNLIFFKMLKDRGIVAIDHAHNAQLSDPEVTRPLRELAWDCVICVSRFVKERWEKLGTGAKKLEVVYNGINLDNYKDFIPEQQLIRLKSDGSALIFFPSRMEKQKNFLLLAKAAKRLAEKRITNFKIVAVYDENTVNERERGEQLEIKKLLDDYGLSDNIVFIPPIDPMAMPSYYAACDIVCVPSINETFGLVYLEAMAAGKAAIATNTGGPQEYISNGENGYVVSPDDPIELANVLEMLLTDGALLEKIGKNSRSTAQKYSIARTMSQIGKIYESLEGEV